MKLEELEGYCIHLANRKDREENMYKELDYFIPNQYNILNGVIDPIGKIGVSMSFKNAIRTAQLKGLEQVLVFEDDVRFTSDKSRERFQMAMNTLPDDWDILLGGVYYCDKLQECNEYMKKVNKFSALHCVLFRNTVYNKIMKHEIDGQKTVHLDIYLSNLSITNKLNIYVAYPMIAIQYEGESNTANRVVNYKNLLDKFEILK